MSARTRRLWFALAALFLASALFNGYAAFWPEGMSSFLRKTGSALLLVASVIVLVAALLVKRRDEESAP